MDSHESLLVSTSLSFVTLSTQLIFSTVLTSRKRTCGGCMQGPVQSEILWVTGKYSCCLLCSPETWHVRSVPRRASHSHPNVTERQSSTSGSSCCPSCPWSKCHKRTFTEIPSSTKPTTLPLSGYTAFNRYIHIRLTWHINLHPAHLGLTTT